MAFWCLHRSPLIDGGNLPENNATDLEILTNPGILHMQSTAKMPYCAFNSSNTGVQVWTAGSSARDDQQYLLVINTGETTQNVNMSWSSVGVDRSVIRVLELWSNRTLPTVMHLNVQVSPHDVAALLLTFFSS